jgi:ribonuclease P protein component
MGLEKEWQQKMVETYLKEEDKKVVTNYQHKKQDIRLKKQKDFDLVFKKGKRITTNTLTLIYIKSESLKFGISLSKKHGKAFKRNKIKRLLRASFNCYVKNISKNYYIIILPKIKEEYNFFDFTKDMEFALKKGNILND